MDVFDRHGSVVDEDSNRQGHSAECHQIQRLSEPVEDHDRDKQRQRDRNENNERAAQLPRKSNIIKPVRPAAMIASRSTPWMAPLTNTDWSNNGCTLSSGGRVA